MVDTGPDDISDRLGNSTGGGTGDGEVMVSTVFWTAFVASVLSPVVLVGCIILFKMSIQDMFQSAGRYRHYGLRSLEWYGSSRFALCYLFMYRHRPLVMEAVLISVELCLLLAMLDMTTEGQPLVLWCAYDLMAAMYTFNAMALTQNSDVPRAVSLAYQIYAIYSLALGFPLGFSFKLLWITWINGRVSFIYILVPFYVGGVAAGACAVFYLGPSFIYHIFKRCQNRNQTYNPQRYRNHSYFMQILAIFLLSCHFAVWFIVFSNVHICQGPHPDLVDFSEDYRPSYDFPCVDNIHTWTVTFLPVSVELALSMLVLVWAVLSQGMFWRFLPELITWWCVTLSVISFFYSLDMEGSDMNNIIYAACLMLISSAIVSIVCNLALLRRLAAAIRIASAQVHIISATPRQDRSNSNPQDVQKARETTLLRMQKAQQTGEKVRISRTLARQVSRRGQLTNCCICWEEYVTPLAKSEEDRSEKTDEDAILEEQETILGVIKQCGHYFHFDCIWDWLERKANCPLCRNNIPLTEEGIQTINYHDLSKATQRQSAYTSRSSRASDRSDVLNQRLSNGTAEPGSQAADGRSLITISNDTMDSDVTVNNMVNRHSNVHRNGIASVHSTSSGLGSEGPSNRSGKVYQKSSGSGAARSGGGHQRGNSHGSAVVRFSTSSSIIDGGDERNASHVQRRKDKRHRRSRSRESNRASRMSNRSDRRSHYSDQRSLGNYTPTNTMSPRTMSRRTRRKCHVCKRRFEGDPRDVVVGYLRGCGHYYHCLCLERFVNRYGYCPICYEHGLAMGEHIELQSALTSLDVYFSLLSDILINLDEPVSPSSSTLIHSNSTLNSQQRY